MDQDPPKPEGQSKPIVEQVGDKISLRYDLNSVFPKFVAPGKAAEIPLSLLDGTVGPMLGVVLAIDRTDRFNDDTGSVTTDHLIRLGVKPSAERSGWRYEEVTGDGQGGERTKRIEAIPLDGLDSLNVTPETRRQGVRVRVFNGKENLGDFEIKIQPQAKDKLTDDDRFTLVVSNVPAGR